MSKMLLEDTRRILRAKMARCDKSDCTDYTKRRFPILSWFTSYKLAWLAQDVLAGFTVGLTAIPQGIAYGVVAGLGPEYGLYASFMASFVYIVFGSCNSITIGPTAIMATMTQPLVSKYDPDMAVLLTFLKGCIITTIGLLHLGFLLNFISSPVITGFTAAASINIAASQFKSLLGISGRSDDFLDSLISVFGKLNEIRYQDTLLGIATIAVLVLFKNLPGRRSGNWMQKVAWSVTLARNAVVVVAGTAMAYIFFINNQEPFVLTGTIGEGLPPFGPPPFSIIANNRTYHFLDMVAAMETTLIFVPIVSAIEHMAIAKAFGMLKILLGLSPWSAVRILQIVAKFLGETGERGTPLKYKTLPSAMGKSLDATQEMLALGMCNMFGSFVRSMPVTGSFTRTAVNHSSGVKTTFGGFFTGCLVLLASGLLTSTFRFIPKATLAGVVICAMYYMLDFKTYRELYYARKPDFALMLVTLLFCVFLKLEWGIIIGIILNLIILLYFSTRSNVQTEMQQLGDKIVIRIIPEETVTFPAAENFRARIMKLSEEKLSDVVLDCKNLKRIDVTVANNLKLLANDLRLRGRTISCVNCRDNVQTVLKAIAPDLQSGSSNDENLYQ